MVHKKVHSTKVIEEVPVDSLKLYSYQFHVWQHETPDERVNFLKGVKSKFVFKARDLHLTKLQFHYFFVRNNIRWIQVSNATGELLMSDSKTS